MSRETLGVQGVVLPAAFGSGFGYGVGDYLTLKGNRYGRILSSPSSAKPADSAVQVRECKERKKRNMAG